MTYAVRTIKSSEELDEMMGHVIQDASKLNKGKRASLLLALYFAALSPMQDLEKNGDLARIMARYENRPLPESKETLYQELKQARAMLLHSHINTLYAIKSWYNMVCEDGSIAQYENVGLTYEEQVNWRESIVIKGMGRKCLSFALLLYMPFDCQLIPVDRHHLARLNACRKNGSVREAFTRQEKSAYLHYEQMLRCEQALTEYADMPSSLYAWCVWQVYRMDTAFQSHVKLNCRDY